MKHIAFISYSSLDQEIANRIVNELENKHGIPCWICTRKLKGGELFKSKIAEAIEETKVVILLQSKNSIRSREVPKEIGLANDADKEIIPVRIDSAPLKGDLKYDLNGIEYIDATLPTLEQRISELAEVIIDGLRADSEEEVEYSLASGRIVCHEIFDGRDALIDEIEEAYRDRDVVFLHGMGGIGKTELACQYWRAHKDYYSTVVLARYESDLATLIADDSVFKIEGVTRRTKADNTPQTDEEYALEKIQIMKNNQDAHTLIILDNFDVLSDPLLDELTYGGSYRLLVTTRYEPERGKYYVIPVKELDDATLKDVFIKYSNPDKTLIDEDDPAFPELFDLTGRHTLTLELIAKYMDEKDMDDISEMVGLLKTQKFAALSDSSRKDGFDVIRKVFSMTSLNEKEKSFMRCLSMMPPAGVSQKLFKKWCGEVFSARSRLVDLSFVRINSKNRTISLHPIIREIVINELQPGYANCADFINRCAFVGEDCINLLWNLPYEEKEEYLDCYAHILECLGEISDETYGVCLNMSHLFNYIAPYSDAIDLLQRLYRFVCEKYGKDSNEAMLMVNRMGWKSSNAMMYDKALEYYKTAADWFLCNPDYYSKEAQDSILGCCDSYFKIYRKTGEKNLLIMSSEYCQKAVEYGAEMYRAAANVSESLRIRCKFQNECISRYFYKYCMEEKKFSEAYGYLEKYKQAVREFMEASGIQADTDMAWYHIHYARLCKETGDVEKAISNLQTAYDLYMKYFSDKNPRVLSLLVELFDCYIDAGRLEDAERCKSEIETIARALYLEDHPVRKRLMELSKKMK